MNRVKGTDKNGDALRDRQELEAITPQGQKGPVEGMVPSRPGKRCSMGDGSLTGAVDRDRGMQLLPKPRGGWGPGGGGFVFLELFLFHFLISRQLLNKKAEGMEGWFTEEGKGGERAWRDNGE